MPACSVYEPSMLDASDSSGGVSLENSASAGAAAGGATGAGGKTTNAGTGGMSIVAGSSGTLSSGGAGGSFAFGGAGSISSKGGAGGSSAGSGNAGAPSGGSAGAGAANGGAPSAGWANGGSAGAGVDACNRALWLASASESSLSTDPPQLYNPPSLAIDGNGSTRWSSGAAQVGGEWFMVDLGAIAAHLTELVLDASGSPSDFPCTFQLDLSSDGEHYATVATGSGSAVTAISFADHAARYVRVTQTGTSTSWWSIHELSLSCQN
jgi:beta-glucosidase